MNICNLQKKNDEDSFLDIYNWGDYIIRYTGVYIVGGFESRFCTLPFFPQEHFKLTFPDDATSVTFICQFWFDETEIWINFPSVTRSLPGEYCFRSAGTLIFPRFDPILCP